MMVRGGMPPPHSEAQKCSSDVCTKFNSIPPAPCPPCTGSPIQLRVVVDPATGGATFDFTGTGLELLGNLNAPPAVTYSAIIYSLRCLVGQDIPLNQGCLKPSTYMHPSGYWVRGGRCAHMQQLQYSRWCLPVCAHFQSRSMYRAEPC